MAYGMSDRKRDTPRSLASDQDQSERFKQTAKELGIDLDEDKLKEALRKVAPREQKEKPKNDRSD